MASDGHIVFRVQPEWEELGQHHRVQIEILPNIIKILKYCQK